MISTLIERLEKATGADREIDVLLGELVDPTVDGNFWRSETQHGMGFAVGLASKYQSIWFTALPYYTGSIDAALGLVERVLPGWVWLKKSEHVFTVYRPLTEQEDADKQWAVHFDAKAATPALSICLAALRALKHREPTND